MTDVIKSLRVTSIGLDNDRLDVLWEYSDPIDAMKYEVWVERSGSISGPFDVVSRTYNAISYTDWYADPDQYEVYAYRLRVVRRDDPNTVLQVTKARLYEMEADVIAAEIRRRNNLLLREYTGVPVLYYPVRTSGHHRCPVCWDPAVQQRTVSRCDSCFDTGYITGYFNPIVMYLQMHEDQTSLSQNAETDEVYIRTSTAWLAGNLHVQIGDLVVETTNDRWLVSTFDVTEKLRAYTSRRARLHHLQESDIRYKVPLPSSDIFDNLKKSREYSRPYTLNP